MRHTITALLSVTLAIAAGLAIGHAQSSSYTMQAGESLTVACQSGLSGTVGQQAASLVCATLVPTPTNTPVPPTPTATMPSGEDHAWHPPTTHEHGDAPPAWVTASRWMPMFDHPGNTPNENVLKHTSFKGFTFRDDGVDVYVIAHLDGHPQGQQTRFHSFQVWLRDGSGAVSHLDYWLDFGTGDNALPNVQAPDPCGNNGQRPIIMVNFPDCPSVTFEAWYAQPGLAGWMADVGFNFSAVYFGGPAKGTLSPGDLARSSEWLPTGGLNLNRRIEMAWYANRSSRRGDFWSTQWGELVSGPADARCGQPRTIGGKTYATLCLAQYLAPTLGSVQFPGNAIQKQYPGSNVVAPN